MSGVFGNFAVEPGSLGGSQRVVPNAGVPMSEMHDNASLHGRESVRADWTNRPRTDPGLCVVCARRNLKGRKVHGYDKCAPHRMADARAAAKTAGD